MEEELIEKIKSENVGKWIGLKDSKVVVTSESHGELYKKLKEQGMNGIYVFYSPTEKEKRYGFLFQMNRWKLKSQPLSKFYWE